MTIYIPTWLYWYGGLPLAFVLGYLLGWTRKREVPPDPYRADEAVRARFDEARALVVADRMRAAESKDAPTTKRARPIDGSTWDEDKS